MQLHSLGAVFAATFLFTIPAVARAQAASTPAAGVSGWRLLAGAGYASVYDDEGSIGKGPEFSVGAGRQFTPTWSIEGVLFLQAHDRRDAFRVDGDATGFIGRVVIHFGEETSTARLFLSGGAGLARHTGTLGFVGGPPEPPMFELRSGYQATGTVTEVGIGVDIAAGRRWFVRPELRARWTSLDRPAGGPEPPYLSGLAGVTVGWRP